MKELTKAEEQIMQVIWTLEKAFVKEVIDKLPEPKPAYNTVSTIIRILESKGFLGYNSYGKSHQYFPLVSKQEYKGFAANKLLSGYFSNSIENMLSFFIKEKKIDIKEMDVILKMIEEHKDDEQ